jgi:hypothetical protein
LKHDSWHSEDRDDITTTYHPAATSRSKPDWLGFLFGINESVIADTLDEIYSALHNGTRRIAAMGIRSLLEYIMIDRIGGDQGTFAANTREFVKAGYIAKQTEQLFERVLESGHAAMHRSYVPSISELKTLLDVTEGLIAQIYVQPGDAERLKIPPRKGKVGATK